MRRAIIITDKKYYTKQYLSQETFAKNPSVTYTTKTMIGRSVIKNLLC